MNASQRDFELCCEVYDGGDGPVPHNFEEAKKALFRLSDEQRQEVVRRAKQKQEALKGDDQWQQAGAGTTS